MKTQDYYEDTVPNYLPDTFKKFFKMSSETVQVICLALSTCDELLEREPRGGREEIPLHKKVLMTLRYMASQETICILEISDRFNVTEFSLLRCKEQVINAMIRVLLKRFIKWPSIADLAGISNRFSTMGDNRLTNVVGAIDGSHIPIEAPHVNANSYYNRKQFHSIILQGVCDDTLKFVDINVGWPGRVHDAKVFRHSQLWETGFSKCDNGRYHLLGDAAYPVKEWLLTPYRDNGHLTVQQKRFNEIHSAKRQVIERAFGMLKRRCRRLKHIHSKSIDRICQTVVFACIIHNICIMQDDTLDDALDCDEDDDEEDIGEYIHQNDAQGILKRIRITNRL